MEGLHPAGEAELGGLPQVPQESFFCSDSCERPMRVGALSDPSRLLHPEKILFTVQVKET